MLGPLEDIFSSLNKACQWAVQIAKAQALNLSGCGFDSWVMQCYLRAFCFGWNLHFLISEYVIFERERETCKLCSSHCILKTIIFNSPNFAVFTISHFCMACCCTCCCHLFQKSPVAVLYLNKPCFLHCAVNARRWRAETQLLMWRQINLQYFLWLQWVLHLIFYHFINCIKFTLWI